MNQMGQKFKGVPAALRVSLCAFLCSLCLFGAPRVFGAPPAQPLPEGKGKAEFVHNCTACHRADMVTRVPKTPEDWKKSVFEMASRGTDGTKEDLDNVVLYLDKFYAKDQPAPAAAAPSAAPSATPSPVASSSPSNSSPSSDPSSSDSEHIKQLIATNLCLSCHRIEQQGAYIGPSLNGVSSRLTDGQIRTAIMTPPPTLAPSDNLVQFTTADGKKVTGHILSQDDQEVRVMAASGDVDTYVKSELQEFTVVDINPMPAYGRRLTVDDVNGLVRYIGSLPPVDDSVRK
ncbi:MAG TPA: c-type cytochrome [Acidobacteriaceae bacterium]|nr:c-type cytochrome [Acidobacteriaceae bacterium]